MQFTLNMFKRRAIAACSVLFLVLMFSADASADWYSDGKAIIEQLIEDDLSTNVIPNAAARVPGLCAYFPASMGAIQSQRYTGLDSVFRKELSDFLGYEVYEDVVQTAAGSNGSATAGIAAAAAPDTATVAAATALKSAETLQRQKIAAARPGVSDDEYSEVRRIVSRNIQRHQRAQGAIGVRADAASGSGSNVGPGSGSGSQPITTSCDGSGSATFDGQTSIATLQMNTCEQTQTGAEEVGCSAGIVVRDAFDGDTSALADDLKRFATAVGLPSDSALLKLIDGKSVVTIDTALALIVAAGEACKALPQCTALAEWASSSGAVSDLITVINDLRKHDYGAAAKIAITSAVSLACGTSTTGICSPDGTVVITFVADLAVYIIDSVSSGQSAESAEDDFREAAVTLIETYGAGLGYSRKWDSAKALLYPQGSLRASYRPGHVSTDESTSLTYASLDFPTLRYPLVYNQYFFFAPQVSLLDLLGGAFEAATTGHLLDNDPHRAKAIAESFFVPRIELKLGSPALTRNLVVGVGAAFRIYDARFDTPTTAHYCFIGDCPVGLNNFEFGVSVTYIP
jgi:hypothetical protein